MIPARSQEPVAWPSQRARSTASTCGPSAGNIHGRAPNAAVLLTGIGAHFARDTARQLWHTIAGDMRTPEAVAAGADRLWSGLSLRLGRWIGASGYGALLNRALGVARSEHACLHDLSCSGAEASLVDMTARTHGAGEVAESMVTVATVLIDLLGRIVGEDMAIHLVNQVTAPSANGNGEHPARGSK